MGKRIKLTKTDVFLLGLTVLFVLAMALTWLLTPRQVRGGYDISAVPPEEASPALLKVNINTASAEELDGLPGIGPVLAQRIVDEREANGPYTGAGGPDAGGGNRTGHRGEHTRSHHNGGYAGMKILVVDDEKLLVKRHEVQSGERGV